MRHTRRLQCAAIAAVCVVACAPAPPPRPNFVMIVTDDQDVETLRFMPIVLRELVDQGTSFSNAFVTITACCPSRTSILRGQYAHNHGVLENNGPNGGYHAFASLGLEDSTLASWMQEAGYRTALIGKFLNGYAGRASYVPSGWDEWYALLNHKYFESRLSDNGVEVTLATQPAEYVTDALAERAVDFIAQDDPRPFFLYLTPLAAHRPADPAPRHRDRFADQAAPRYRAFNEADVSDKTRFVRKREHLSERQIEEIDALYRNRLRTLLAVDEMVGRIISTLEKTGRLENTFFFFLSDSGFHLGDHRLPGGKGGPYERSIRIPLIVRGPGVRANRTVDAFALHTDLAPTVMEWVGLPTPGFVDGRSLVPWLGTGGDAAASGRKAFLIENWGDEGRGFQALRSEHRIYVEWNGGEREFYDLRRDPDQLENAYTSLAPAVAEQLAAAVKQFRDCAAASCRQLEDAFVFPEVFAKRVGPRSP